MLKDAKDVSKINAAAYQVSAQPSGTAALAVTSQSTSVTITLSDTYAQGLLKDALARSVEVVRKRLNETGLTEPTVTLQGSDAILVQMPGMSDPLR